MSLVIILKVLSIFTQNKLSFFLIATPGFLMPDHFTSWCPPILFLFISKCHKVIFASYKMSNLPPKARYLKEIQERDREKIYYGL